MGNAIGLPAAAANPCPTSGDRNRLSYDVLRLKLRDGVLAPSGGWSPLPEKKAASPPRERSLSGGAR